MAWPSIVRRALLACSAASLVAAAAVGAWVATPLPENVAARVPSPSVTLEDRSGVVLRATRAGDGSRTRWIALSEMDPDVLRAFIAVEDRRFFEHRGIDIVAVARAARDNVRRRRVVSGASTITMQLARLVRPAPRSWRGKVAQALWALRLEAHLDKQEILEQYLNRVHLGQGTVGVGAASALYFASSAAELSVGQAALLAGLAHAPSSNNPLVSSTRAAARRRLALDRMRGLGMLTDAEHDRARGEPLVAPRRSADFRAPHFTTRALLWARDSGAVANGRWHTTLDLALQEALEAEVRHTVAQLAERGARQAAAVVLDNRTGDVLAWVGSPDFFSDTGGQTDMVVSPRQPGSALKPFLYALAFDRGYTPASVVADVARTYRTSTGPYRPRNYDHRFRGPVRMREALGSSYNVPAVEVTERLGASSLLMTLRAGGFASLARSAEHYGLGLSLGNGDVTLLELANGYRALANGGIWRPVRWRADAPSSGEPRRVVSNGAAALVLDILADPEARVPGFGVQTPFDFPFRVAVKTGTSRHFTDNWAVATTAGFTVAVWVGDFSGRAMQGVSGITGAGPLLQRAVLLTARRYAPGDLTRPSAVGAVAERICRLSGKRAGRHCPHALEWFLPGTAPTEECDWHVDGATRLPSEYAEWEHGLLGGPISARAALAASMPRAEPPSDAFRISSPRHDDRYRVPAGVDGRYSTVALRAIGSGADRVAWFVNGKPTGSSRFGLVPGVHRIVARSESGAVDSVTVYIEQ